MLIKILLNFGSVAQLCPALCDPTHDSLPGSSDDGILQARILEKGAISSSRDLHDPGIQPSSLVSPAMATEFVTARATWRALYILWIWTNVE